jgi:hypothetical protein
VALDDLRNACSPDPHGWVEHQDRATLPPLLLLFTSYEVAIGGDPQLSLKGILNSSMQHICKESVCVLKTPGAANGFVEPLWAVHHTKHIH